MTFALRRRRPLAALAASLLVPLAACTSGGGTPDIAVPEPRGEAAGACRALSRALPDRLTEEERGELDEETPYAAVWGDPAIVLRCGVARPALLTPGNAEYNPMADAVEVNGVSWLIEEEPDDVRFTTTERTVFVEVTVPGDYAPEVNPLTGLARPVADHIPLDPLYAQLRE